MVTTIGGGRRTLLNILQYRRQFPTAKNYLAQNVNRGDVEKPGPTLKKEKKKK